MADTNDIPPIPLPPQGSAVPPVEPPPATPPAAPAPPAPPVAPAQPVAPQPLPPVAPPAPGGYAAPASPYAAPQPYGAAPQQHAPQPYGAPGAYAVAPAGPAQGLSVASMVTGIASVVLSFVWLGFLPAVAAVILGHIAQRRQPYARAFWLTGLITGYIGLGIAVLGFFFLVIIGISGALNDY